LQAGLSYQLGSAGVTIETESERKMPSIENDAFQNDDEENSSRHRTNGVQKKGLPPPSYDDLDEDHHHDQYPSEHAKDLERSGAGLENVTFEDAPAPKQTFKEVWRDYPKSVLCIVGNEFCERFSYYGMRAILTLYLINVLKYKANTATAINSGFVMLCYFSPILGSTLADGYIGKFHTILWVSLFYSAGNVTIAVAASFDDHSVVHPWLDFIGLAIIGLGTGGIKPCVQTFGGDQFRKGQEKQLQQFFSIFYFAINAGSTISILLTPIFRTQPCQGRSTCYPLAFGIPAALMIVAVVFFAVGTYWYKKVPPEGNVFAKVGRTVGTAINNKRTFDVKRDHWLDHYMDSHSCAVDEECRAKANCEKSQFVKDLQALLRVLVVYVPVPIFWALFEQQGSTWVIQGTQMNSEIGPGIYFLPDQMGVLNAVLIMALIPIFEFGVYPLAAKCFKVTPLRKMSIGGLIAGVAYIVCMFVQIAIRDTLPPLPASHQTLVTVNNYVQQCDSIKFTAFHGETQLATEIINRNRTHMFTFKAPDQDIEWKIDQGSNTSCQWVTDNKDHLTQPKIHLDPNIAGYTIFTDDSTDLKLHKMVTEKSSSGESVFTINVNHYANKTTWIQPDAKGILRVALCKDDPDWPCSTKNSEKYKEFEVDVNTRTSEYIDLKPGTWSIFVPNGNNTKLKVGKFNKKENGGIFSLTLLSMPDDKVDFDIARQAPDNTINILWQVPQYFVISLAEILFSITGNEFAYSQAPLSMKAVVMALWLLTDSIGNVIILIIATVSTSGFDMSWIFLIYAALMFAVMIIFMYIAYRYKYVLYVRDDDKTG
jgi:dipeptide/tripeptide permease